MRRLVYAPKVHAFVRTEDAAASVVNLSDYIVRGNVHRRTNAVSTIEIELRNPDKMFTHPGRPLLRPMDPITVYLTRIKDRPIQAFTGYLDTTPYIQLFPGTVTLTASCTLKRLLHTYWDPSLPYVFDGFLREYGWNLNPKTGQMFSEKLYDGPTLDKNSRALNDGSFGSLLYATLKHIGQWKSDDIYIEKLPDGTNGSADIVKKVTAIYNTIAEDNKAIQSNIEELFKGLLGTGPLGGGGGPLGDPPNAGASYDIGELVQLAEAMGLRGEAAAISAAIAMAESSGDPTQVNEIECVGLWQINSRVHKNYTIEELQDPVKNGKEMIRISGNGSHWDDWTVYTGADTPGHEKTYLKFLDAARKALSDPGDEPDADKWREQRDSKKNSKENVPEEEQQKQSKETTPANGAAPKDTANKDPKEQDTADDETRDKLLNEDNLKGRYGSGMAALDGAKAGLLPIARLAQIMSDGAIDVSAGRIHHAPGTLHELGRALDLAVIGVNTPDPKKDALAKIIWRLAPITEEIIYKDQAVWEDGKTVAYGKDDHFNHIHVALKTQHAEDPEAIADAVISALNGEDIPEDPGGGGGGPASDAGGNSNASAFAAYLNLPGVLDVGEAIGLAGQKSLLNDQALFPFVQQLCQGSLRNFMSMPNGKFFAFFPDHFGGFSHRTPYWLIDDIEILDGHIDLTDEFLATHVYIIGDINFDQTIDMLDRLQSGGVMDLESAFKSGFIKMPDETISVTSGDTGGLGVEKKMDRTNVLKFLQRYGARPYKEELPMIRSPFFEAFLAYQKFMELWAKQFATKFEFTFMPELYPGGIVGLWEHGVQCYVEEVIHTFDYEGGFATQAILSSPAAMAGSTVPNISAGMVREGDVASLPAGKPKKKK